MDPATLAVTRLRPASRWGGQPAGHGRGVRLADPRGPGVVGGAVAHEGVGAAGHRGRHSHRPGARARGASRRRPGLLLLAIALATLAILPHLGSARRHRRERHENLVYFGHLRMWQAGELGQQLAGLSSTERSLMLSRQLVTMSRINWRKHRSLQASVAVLLLALLTVTGQAALTWVG
ncbi:Pycsar system effector family protein [Micromonospora sp. NBS 11-29]|uniref:Pycsar system effector family protein n=1 Tax=Micromonospora sp. NBS 11-29 TaxID=1960879 RepID=UPI0020CFA7E7|nr:Pycsar system effector family protein [Micromonospora sp. NBS 11-29]